MKLVMNEAVNMVINILLFSFIPWIIYVCRNRTYKGFFNSIGLFITKVNVKKIGCIYAIMYFISLGSLLVLTKIDRSMVMQSVNVRENGLQWNIMYLIITFL